MRACRSFVWRIVRLRTSATQVEQKSNAAESSRGKARMHPILPWQDATPARPTEWARRLCFVRGFARHWSAHDSCTAAPPPGLLAARRLPSDHGLRGPTYYSLLGLLAMAGLRISEARNLQTEDVDLQNGVLTIRGTKFGKCRLVPVYPSTRKVLSDYASRRGRFLGTPSRLLTRSGR